MARVAVVMMVKEEDKGLNRRLELVLGQLDDADEVLIAADSPCLCEDALKNAATDIRVKIVCPPERSPLKNLEAALRQVSGEYIFLAGQSDTWHPDKRKACAAALKEPGVMAAIHDAVIVDGDLNEIENSLLRHRFHAGLLRNLFRNRFYCSCMAFRKEVLQIALPFPPYISKPGRWLGIAAGKTGRVAFISRTLVFYCRRKTRRPGMHEAYGVRGKFCAVREVLSLFFVLSRRARRKINRRDNEYE